MTQQIKLKVLWLKNSLGLAIDYKLSNQTYSLSQYYFWPKTEAWDQLKLELETKHWLTKPEKIKVLNLTTKVMNQWKNSQSLENFDVMETDCSGINIIKVI